MTIQGRALLARQQSGLIELGNLYGALEDWELRVYRQMWSRAKQFWKAPQWIRVTDDENAPKFVGLNMPDPTHPLGYRNLVGEMDVDIEIDATTDVANIAAGAVQRDRGAGEDQPGLSAAGALEHADPAFHHPAQAQHPRPDQAGRRTAAGAGQAQAQQIAQAGEAAKIAETQARTGLHQATGFAKVTDSLTYAHAAHADHIAAGWKRASTARSRPGAGPRSAMQSSDQAASAQMAQSDQAHQAAMAAQAATARPGRLGTIGRPTPI